MADNNAAGDRPIQPDPQDAMRALQGLLQTQEAQVLGAMGLIVGYICVLFAKILNLTNFYYGVCGVALVTMLLLTLSNTFDWRSPAWWLRSAVITIICVVVTSPQLYFAWTVSVTEAQTAGLALHTSEVNAASAPSNNVPVTIHVTNSSGGN